MSASKFLTFCSDALTLANSAFALATCTEIDCSETHICIIFPIVKAAALKDAQRSVESR
jgi:hypothetical protein